MSNEFYALMGRMRYITRWGLMRNRFSENIQEHSHQMAALYHDASEILNGVHLVWLLKEPMPLFAFPIAPKLKFDNSKKKKVYLQRKRPYGEMLIQYIEIILESTSQVGFGMMLFLIRQYNMSITARASELSAHSASRNILQTGGSTIWTGCFGKQHCPHHQKHNDERRLAPEDRANR